MVKSSFQPKSAFDRLALSALARAGVIVEDLDGTGQATVVARRDRVEDVAAGLLEALRLELAPGPVVSHGRGVKMVGTGPENWLAIGGDANVLAPTLKRAIGHVAAVCDQTDGYGLLRLSGDNAEDLLSRLAPVDLHLSRFKVGSAASTTIAHIPVILWRLEPDVFELAVFRSFARSLWSVFTDTADGLAQGASATG
jgi:sarcosine oxidase subunit gamma